MGKSKTNPCISRCTVSLGDEVCKGCGRTCKQVAEWNSYPKEKKEKIVEELRNGRI